MAKEVGQEYSRVDVTMFDPHGRPWHAILERKTMTPTGPISPLFKAPFYPDQKYLRPGGQKNPIRLGIDYDAMDRDLQEAHLERERRLHRLAFRTYGSQAPKVLKNPPEELLRALDGEGAQPMPVEVVWACMQGNRFVLGFSENEPEWVKKDQRIHEFFHPPLKEMERKRAKTRFADADEDADTEQQLIPLSDAETAPVDPRLALAGSEIGGTGEDSSWGQPATSGGRTALRKE